MWAPSRYGGLLFLLKAHKKDGIGEEGETPREIFVIGLWAGLISAWWMEAVEVPI